MSSNHTLPISLIRLTVPLALALMMGLLAAALLGTVQAPVALANGTPRYVSPTGSDIGDELSAPRRFCTAWQQFGSVDNQSVCCYHNKGRRMTNERNGTLPFRTDCTKGVAGH